MKGFKRLYVITTVILILLVSVAGCGIGGKKEFKVKEHLNEVILTINDTEFTLEDIGYYIANGEAAVEAQALVYSPDDPQKYWNKHTNGIFIKVQAKENVMDNFTRDCLLAVAAKDKNISLSDDEKQQCQAAAESAYEQLNSYQCEGTGITVETLSDAMQNAYLGEKYVEYRLENDGTSEYTTDDWKLDGLCYNGLMSEYKIKVNDELWEKVDFGNITIER